MADVLTPTGPTPTTDPSGQHIVLPGQAPDGEHILAVLVKRSYSIQSGQRCRRAAKDRKLVAGDTHFGDPMNTSVQYESDFVPVKLATDVVLNGHAYAPDGKATFEIPATLSVDDVVRSVLVIGDRTAHHRAGTAPVFSDPVSFTRMPLR